MSEATAHSDQEVTAEEEATAPASDGIQTTQEAGNAGLADSGEEANAGVIPESPVEATPNMAERIGSADSVEDFERLMDEVEMNPQALAGLSDPEAVPEQNASTWSHFSHPLPLVAVKPQSLGLTPPRSSGSAS